MGVGVPASHSATIGLGGVQGVVIALLMALTDIMGVDWPHYCWVALKVLTLQYVSSETQQGGAKALHYLSLLLHRYENLYGVE